uniref:Golgi associated, gamma adaptin ear containing, ARF binding protein 1 n=1 Tax=Esox lucius TaxID=8010 RepID=A0A3P8XW87_ESOLU
PLPAMKSGTHGHHQMLRILLYKATNPLNRDTDWDSVQAFCDQLNYDLEGPQFATRLLAHKIQSPQEWEAMQALTVLETCMKSCGRRFHSEVGKFRFLNELIKVVSPKYLGTRAPEPVKKKVLELIYSWTLGLPNEAKIAEAYHMLKKQGIVKQDPVLPADHILGLPLPRPKNAIFEDEEKSKTLARLLNSPLPEDLKADRKRAEKVSKRVNTIKEVNESVSLLTQLLEDHGTTTNPHSNDLYQRCEKMRPTLFRLASDTEDNDEALGLSEGTHVFNEASHLGDSTAWDTFQSSDSVDILEVPAAPTVLRTPDPSPGTQLPQPGARSGISALDELDQLGKTLLQQSLPPEGLQVKWDRPLFKPTLRDLQNKPESNPSPLPAFSPERPEVLSNSQPSIGASSLDTPQVKTVVAPVEFTLAGVFVQLDSVKPSNLLPVTVYDGHSLRVLFHFGRDSPPSRPDVLVVIISMLSSAPVPLRNILFQASVPETMKVKLQPASGTALPAYNPVLPPAAITQILLLANPHKEKVKLQYKLTFTLGEEDHDESGVVEEFPPWDTWGNL